jgi:hypothetical protein
LFIYFYYLVISQCLHQQHASGILQQHDACHYIVIIIYLLCIYYLVPVGGRLAEVLADI